MALWGPREPLIDTIGGSESIDHKNATYLEVVMTTDG